MGTQQPRKPATIEGRIVNVSKNQTPRFLTAESHAAALKAVSGVSVCPWCKR